MTIENTITGSLLELKSSENKESLKGKGLDLLIVDEAGDVPDEVWDKYLRANISEKRPQLNGKKGRAVVIGNASIVGSWFHRLYAQDLDDKFSYHMPSAIEEDGNIIDSANPEIVTKKELQLIKSTSSERTWKVEYLAEFLSGEGQVFRNIHGNIAQTIMPPEYGHRYLVGVDLARKQDFTVVCVIDIKTRGLVHFDRFNMLDWEFQKNKIQSVSERYNRAKVTIDSTALGDVIVSDLQRRRVNVEAFHFTNESKKQVVEKLAFFLEKGEIQYPNTPELISELENFQYKKTATGRLQYSAPTNLHDDCVIALALACWHLTAIPSTENLPGALMKERKEAFKKMDLWSKIDMKRGSESKKSGPYPYR